MTPSRRSRYEIVTCVVSDPSATATLQGVRTSIGVRKARRRLERESPWDALVRLCDGDEKRARRELRLKATSVAPPEGVTRSSAVVAATLAYLRGMYMPQKSQEVLAAAQNNAHWERMP